MQQLSSSNQLVSNGMWSPLLQFCTRLFPTLSAWPYEIIVFLFKQRQSAKIFPRDPPVSPWLRVRISCHTSTSKMIQLASLATQASRGMLSGYTAPGLKNPRLTNCRVHTLTPHPHVHTLSIHTLPQLEYTYRTRPNAHTIQAHTHMSMHTHHELTLKQRLTTNSQILIPTHCHTSTQVYTSTFMDSHTHNCSPDTHSK